MGKVKMKKSLLVVSLIVLLVAAITGVCMVVMGRQGLPVGKTYQWTYKKPFGREADENMTIDGKLNEKVWKNQKQMVQMENGIKVTATTVFTEKGLYVGLAAMDENVVWKMRHNYGQNSSFKVVITKENEVMYNQNNYNQSFPITRHAFLQIDAKNCSSYRETPYQGKAYVDGTLNSGETKSISAELFLTWEDLNYTAEELGQDGMPEVVEIYVDYGARGKTEAEGNHTIAASFTKEWQFETYFHFGKDGLIAEYDSKTIGNANNGPAASDQWNVEKTKGKETATATEERLQVIWLKEAYSTDFVAETTILPLKTELNINNACGFVMYKDSSTYNMFAMQGKNIASGSSIHLTTFKETDAYHWESQVVKQETVVPKDYTSDTVTLKVIKNAGYLYYFYNNQYWGYQYISDLEDACHIGLFTNGAATFSDWTYTDYSDDAEELREILSEHVYFVTTSGVKSRGSVTSDLTAVKKGESVTLSIIPASGCILTDFTKNGKDMYKELISKMKDGEFVYTPTSDVDFEGTFAAIDDAALVDTQILIRNKKGEPVHDTTYIISGKNQPLLIYTGSPNSSGNIIISLPKAGTYKVANRTLKVGGTYSLIVKSDGYHTYKTDFTLNDKTTSINMDGEAESVAKDASFTKEIVLTENAFGGTVVVNDIKVSTNAKLEYNEATGNYYTNGRGCFTYFKHHVASQYIMNVTMDIEDLGQNSNLSGIAITTGKGSIVLKGNSGNPGRLIIATGSTVTNTTEELALNGFAGFSYPQTKGELTFKVIRFNDVILLYDNKGVLRVAIDSSGMKLLNGTTIGWGQENLEKINERLTYIFKAGPENAVGMVKYGSTGKTEWDIDFDSKAQMSNKVKVNVTYLDGKKATFTTTFNKGLNGTFNGVTSHNFFAVAAYLNGIKIDLNSGWDKYLIQDAHLQFNYDSSTTKTSGVGNDVNVATNGKVTLTGCSGNGEMKDEVNPLTPTEKLWAENTSRAIWVKGTDKYSVLKTTVTAEKFTNGVAGFAIKVNNALAVVGINKTGKVSIFSYQAGTCKQAEMYNVGSNLDWQKGVEMALVQSDGMYYLIVNGKMAAAFADNTNWSYGWNADIGNQFGFAQRGNNVLHYTDYSYSTGEAAVKKYLPNSSTVTVEYLDGRTEKKTTIFGKGLQGILNGVTSHNFFAIGAYLDGNKIDLSSNWDKYLIHNAVLKFDYDSTTTNTGGVGNDVVVGKDDKLTLTGCSGNGEMENEVNPLTPTEKLWADNASRGIWVKGADKYSVLKATVTAEQFTNGVAGFAIKVNNALAIVGINKTGSVSIFSYQAGACKDVETYNVGKELDWENGVEMAFIQDNGTYYLTVNGKMAAVFKNNTTWSYGWNAEIGTTVGFAQRGNNVLHYTDYSYNTGQTAVKKCLPEKVKVTVEYLDGSTKKITSIFGKGLQGKLDGVTSHEFFSVATYLDGAKINLNSNWDKYLIQDATLKFDYDCTTTNTGGVGNDVTVGPDGKVTLTGCSGSGEMQDEVNPLTPTEKLWAENTSRAIWTKGTGKYSVLKATITADSFTNGVAGFSIYVNDALAVVGINKSGSVSIFSYQAGICNDAETYNVGRGLDWEEGVQMTFICADDTYYLIVNGKMAAVFENNTTWSYGWSAEIGTAVGFAQRGNNVLQYTDYSYSTGEAAVKKCLPEQSKVTVEYLDGSTEEMTTVFGEGLQGGFSGMTSHTFFATTAFLDGFRVDLNSAWDKYLIQDASLKFAYDITTTNLNGIENDVTILHGGKVTLSGRTGNGQFFDELNPADLSKLWAGNTSRAIWTNGIEKYSVLQTTVTAERFTNGQAGFAIKVNDTLAIVGIDKAGNAVVYSYKTGNNPNVEKFNVGSGLDWSNGVEMALVQADGTYYLVVNNRVAAVFENNQNWEYGGVAVIGTQVGFAQRGDNVVHYTDYSYSSGEDAVKNYLGDTSSVTIQYLDGSTEKITAVFGEGLQKELEGLTSHAVFATTAYLDGAKVDMNSNWDKYLIKDTTLTIDYDCSTTNTGGLGSDVTVATDGKVTLTGRTGSGQFRDEVNPANTSEPLWEGNTSRAIWTKVTDKYSVLTTTVRAERFAGGQAGFAIKVNDVIAIVGIGKTGNVSIYSYKTGNNVNAEKHTVELSLDWENGVEMTIVNADGIYYLIVNDIVVAVFENNKTWEYGGTAVIGTQVGFAQRGDNVLHYTDYSYSEGKEAVDAHLPKTVQVSVTYPDGSADIIESKYGEGLQVIPAVGYNNPFLKTYLNGKEVNDLKTICKYLVADATVSYTYTSYTTNTTAGTGIAMETDGTVTLIGPSEDKEYTNEKHPVHNGNLWGANTVRQIWTTQENEYSIIQMDVKLEQFKDNQNPVAGIALEANGCTTVLGIRKAGAVLMYTYGAGYDSTKTYTPSGTGTERLVFVSDGDTHYFYVNDKLIWTIKDSDLLPSDNGSSKTVSIGTKIGFGIRGVGKATFTNYTYQAGKDAVDAYLSNNVSVSVTYPDGTQEIIKAVYGEGLEKTPAVGYDNPFLTTKLNGEVVADLREACKTLTGNATVTYEYASYTTNTTAGNGIAMAANGTVILTGPSANKEYTDEKHPQWGNNLWGPNTVRQIWAAKQSEYSVLQADVKLDVLADNPVAGIALEVNGCKAVLGIRQTGAILMYTYGAGYDSTKTYTPSGTGTERLVFVSNGDTHYFFVNGTLIWTIKDSDKLPSDNSSQKTVSIGTKIGFGIRGTGKATFSNYSYQTGKSAVDTYLAEVQ